MVELHKRVLYILTWSVHAAYIVGLNNHSEFITTSQLENSYFYYHSAFFLNHRIEISWGGGGFRKAAKINFHRFKFKVQAALRTHMFCRLYLHKLCRLAKNLPPANNSCYWALGGSVQILTTSQDSHVPDS